MLCLLVSRNINEWRWRGKTIAVLECKKTTSYHILSRNHLCTLLGILRVHALMRCKVRKTVFFLAFPKWLIAQRNRMCVLQPICKIQGNKTKHPNWNRKMKQSDFFFCNKKGCLYHAISKIWTPEQKKCCEKIPTNSSITAVRNGPTSSYFKV